jgi:hypothetical protein
MHGIHDRAMGVVYSQVNKPGGGGGHH